MERPIRLRVEQGPEAGRVFVLAEGALTIGRQEGNTIVIDDRQLSRSHARVANGPDGPIITDLGSANGTYVNDQRIDAPQPLHPGDRLRLGETILLVESESTAADPGMTMPVPLPQAPTAPIPTIRANLPRLVRQDTLQVYALDRPETTIGRQADNTIVLTDTQVSRQHARVTVSDTGVTITDLNSANGTRVNGTPITGPTSLRDGDTIQIGITQFQGGGMGAAPDADGETTIGSGAAVPPHSAPPPFLGTAPLPPMAFPPAPQISGGWQGSPPPSGAFYQAPPAPPARRSKLPFLLGGLTVLVLLVCLGVGGVLAFTRFRGLTLGGTPTPVRTSVASVPLTPTAVSTATPTVTPTSTPLPTATIVAVLPTLAPTATTAPASPTRASTPTPGATTVPRATPTIANGATQYTAAGVGLSFNVPAGWTKVDEQADRVTFIAPSREAQFTARWSTTTNGVTSDRILQQELAATAQLDKNFVAARVQITPARIGGQPGSKTDQYNYTAANGARAELDVASVLPGSGQYFFSFLAIQGRFSANEAAFVTIIDSIQINPPQ
jgi:pSer/pThr/pTyr-binding forkhead associated (FHA) protein